MDLNKLSEVVKSLKESATMALDAKAKAMIAAGEPVINLTAGEPDFPPPKTVRDAVVAAQKKNRVKYTPAGGTLSLRQAIADKIKRDYNLKYDPKTEIVVTNGGKEAISLALLALVDPGDEVLVIKPYWTSYPEMVKLFSGRPIEFDVKDISKIAKFVSDSSPKAIILNSPGNPTSKVFTREELENFREIDSWIISDEIYDAIVFGQNKHISVAALGPKRREKTIIVNGASKSLAMTGYRLGYAAGPREVIRAMAAAKSQFSGCPSALSQAGAEAGFGEAGEDVEKMRQAYEKRAEEIIKPFARKMGLEHFDPQGAFYLFFRLPEKFKGDCATFCQKLLEEEKVALVPGSAFGYPGWARLSFAIKDKILKEALARIARFLNQ